MNAAATFLAAWEKPFPMIVDLQERIEAILASGGSSDALAELETDLRAAERLARQDPLRYVANHANRIEIAAHPATTPEQDELAAWRIAEWLVTTFATTWVAAAGIATSDDRTAALLLEWATRVRRWIKTVLGRSIRSGLRNRDAVARLTYAVATLRRGRIATPAVSDRVRNVLATTGWDAALAGAERIIDARCRVILDDLWNAIAEIVAASRMKNFDEVAEELRFSAYLLLKELNKGEPARIVTAA